MTTRRNFIKTTGLASAAIGTGAALAGCQALGMQNPKQVKNPIPRWRGFNILDYFNENPDKQNLANITTEDDLRWMVDWGFDFIRIPLSYHRYITFNRNMKVTPEDVYKIDEKVADDIDALVNKVLKHGFHVSLNLHRAPGYCINDGNKLEPYDLFLDEEAQKAFCFHWAYWAKRFKALPGDKLSFNLVNEPTVHVDVVSKGRKNFPVRGDDHRELVKKAAAAIRSENPSRLIIADGNRVAAFIVPEIEDLNILQSVHCYRPDHLTFWKAQWAHPEGDQTPTPTWPDKDPKTGMAYGREQLEDYFRPWAALAKRGVGVHCGELGCWSETPHAVALAWLNDVLDILTQSDIGYSVWNFKGEFGVLDSKRKDVALEDWHGHPLDRKLLDLLKKY